MVDCSQLVVLRYVLMVTIYQCVEILMMWRPSPSVAVVVVDMVCMHCVYNNTTVYGYIGTRGHMTPMQHQN